MYRMLVLLVAGCSYPPPHASIADARRANVALDDLVRGRALLVQKCSAEGGCHRTPLPRDAPASEWPDHVEDMAERAKLDAPQQQLIEQYLVVMSGRGR